MRYEKTIYVSKKRLETIRKFLEVEPDDKYECLGEDGFFVETAKFDNGIEMDVKCCGVQYEEGESNTAWTEAVLFKNGSEVCCSEPSDEFEGEWELEYNGDTYIVNIVPELTPGETDVMKCVCCRFWKWFEERQEYGCEVKGCWEGSKFQAFDPANPKHY